ncbi:hypothetical protein OG458_41985 (plasmid) [Streptomyces sp. NBC_01281]|uniref:hypothetical protein n=1 Tax=Streptomyces sp. NBC_01281 TaxID=2903811 RepID=UPI002E1020B6|nr:hypothetical protein OG458_41985 [Streptomyces sp. NBC_01281]
MDTPPAGNAHDPQQHSLQHFPQHSRRRLFTVNAPSKIVWAAASGLLALAAAEGGGMSADAAAWCATCSALAMLAADCIRRG